MAAIRHSIQKDLFSPSDERILAIVSVTKAGGRKKRHSFITLSVNPLEHPPVVLVSRIKSSDKKEASGKEAYKRVKTWPVSELRSVDGHSADGLDFDLQFERQVYKWVASSVAEKKNFITAVYKAVHKYLEHKKPTFVNIDEERLKQLLLTTSETKKRSSGELEDDTLQKVVEEYPELSPQAEADLENLLLRDNAIQDAAAFMENLSEELSQLDQGNIHSLMGSEVQITQLLEHLDQAVMEIEKMETRLDVYDTLLSNVRESMSKIGSHYSVILLQNTNLKALCQEVEDLVNKLDLDSRVESILCDTPLTTPSNIRDCEAAAQTLQQALNQELGPGISILQAVSEQKELFAKLSATFGRRLHEHLSTQFVQNSTLMLENAQVRHTSGPSITSHSQLHTDLLNYSSLTRWLKECEPVRFSEVMEAYVRSFRRVYEDEIRALVSEARVSLSRGGGIELKRPGGLLGKVGSNTDLRRSQLTSSLQVLSPSNRGGGFISQSVADFSASTALASPAQEHSPNRPKFEQIFRLLLDQLQPVCVSEQKFLMAFFHFSKPPPPDGSDNLDQVDAKDHSHFGDESGEDVDSARNQRASSEPMDPGLSAAQGDVYTVLGQLFSILLPEIENFIAFGEKVDSYNALYLLVSVSQRLMFTSESGGAISYLDETLRRARLHIKRLFDKFISNKKRQIEEMKIPRSGKCGILPCVAIFEEFADHAESIVMGTERRAELDKAYQQLIDALFKTVERAAVGHPKTPPDVIKFENYNKVVDILSRLKISCLEMSRDEAKRKKLSHKKVYVNQCLGKPLDKLSVFFEGVESLKASGTKAEEVGYRLDYSRNELKKCIKEYPGKEVKRGLEKLYRRVEKDVSEEVLQVVWGGMQEAFIEQCRRFESLISECYPGANITLDFTVNDLAEYFASISAQK